MYQRASHWTDFRKIFFWGLFHIKYSKKLKIWLKLDKKVFSPRRHKSNFCAWLNIFMSLTVTHNSTKHGRHSCISIATVVTRTRAQCYVLVHCLIGLIFNWFCIGRRERWCYLANLRGGVGGGKNRPWVLGLKSKSQVRKRGTIGSTQSLYIIIPFSRNVTPILLFAPVKLSSK